jgi:hypothetical protein
VDLAPHPFDLVRRVGQRVVGLLPEQQQAVVLQEVFEAVPGLRVVDAGADLAGELVGPAGEVVEDAHALPFVRSEGRKRPERILPPTSVRAAGRPAGGAEQAFADGALAWGIVLAYLSDEWVAAVNEALAGLPPGADGAPESLTIHQRVTGGPRGDRAYALWFADGTAGAGRQVPGGAEPDVSFTCDWDTAVAISTGKERAQNAFLSGRLRLGGDSRILLAHAGALASLDDVLAAVRARTDFTG